MSKTESVSVAAYKPPSSPSSGGGEVEVSGDITATFEAEGTGMFHYFLIRFYFLFLVSISDLDHMMSF